jgi:hypothetical protein
MKSTYRHFCKSRIKFTTSVILSLFLLNASYAQLKVKPGEKVTTVGERQEMQCGEHRIALTCGHSDEIAQRQNTRPRLCNDNRVNFIAKDGSSKTITTFSKGPHRDKTPVRIICQVLLPIDYYEVAVWTHDTAWSFAINAAEDGVRLNNDKGTDLKLKNYPSYSYHVDYQESRKVGELHIREEK